jgi:hypothetical protein
MYLSGGSAAKYKNRKKIINIYHEQNFGLSSEWYFFTTSHGKRPADGMGGTVKRLAAKSSLQKVYSNQIQTFINCSITAAATFFYVQEEQILNCKKEFAD